MSNPVHEALLRQGLADWNEWRHRNRSVIPDLRGLAMSAANLSGADLSHASLSGAVLIRTKLVGADLRYTDLRSAQLHEADFTDADLYHASLEGAALPGAKLRRSRLVGASLQSAALTVVDFRSANLSEADFTRADLRESQCAGATLERAKLDGAELFGCRLNGANLRGATGISARQLEEAIIDDLTSLPEGFAASGADLTIQSLCGALESMKARSTGSTVPENEVSSYHALLHTLEIQGIATDGARIDENAPGTSVVDAALFKSRIDSVLDGLRRKL
ncbi:MAG TPA: pentapeptide repeat-containing protein [Vicinamibacteria bacterium]